MKHKGTAMKRSTEQILADTKRYIAERGWIQGMLEDDKGCVCLWGALTLAVTDGKTATDAPIGVWNKYGDPTEVIIKDAILAHKDDYEDRWDIDEFNDHPKTTLDDVNAVLDIALAEVHGER